jgi:glycosyltransferase involved in cell wall biosynthesis
MNKKNQTLNLMTSLGGDTLGVVGVNLLKSFQNNNIDVSLFPIPVAEKLYFNDQKEYDISIGSIRYSRNFDYNTPTLKIWHPHDLAVKPGNGPYFVFIIPYSNSLTSSEIHNLNFTDGIFTHSDEIIDILKKHKVKSPIYKVDLGVNPDIFTPSDCNKPDDNPYVFYSTGRWSLINGYDIIIKCFNDAFNINDNVVLRLLPYNEFLTEEEESKWLQSIDESKLKDNIIIYNKLNNQYELTNFIADSDCLLSLHRISHSGLNVLEAGFMGKPIIYSDIGMNNQYHIDGNHSISMNTKQAAYDNRLLFGDCDWYTFENKQIQDIITAMKYHFDNKIRSRDVPKDFAMKYSWDNTAKTILDILYIGKKNKPKTRAKKIKS